MKLKVKFKDLLGDTVGQELEEKMPEIVRRVLSIVPKGMLSNEDALWNKVQPYLKYFSIGLGQVIPKGTIADTARARFFAEVKRQSGSLSQKKEETKAMEKDKEGVASSDAILSLGSEEIQKLLDWAEHQDEKEHHEIMNFLKRLSLVELQKFVALEDPMKTKLYELQRKHHSHFFSDGKKEWDELLTKATEGIENWRKEIWAKTEARGPGESLTEKLEAWRINSQARTAARRAKREEKKIKGEERKKKVLNLISSLFHPSPK